MSYFFARFDCNCDYDGADEGYVKSLLKDEHCQRHNGPEG